MSRQITQYTIHNTQYINETFLCFVATLFAQRYLSTKKKDNKKIPHNKNITYNNKPSQQQKQQQKTSSLYKKVKVVCNKKKTTPKTFQKQSKKITTRVHVNKYKNKKTSYTL